MSSKGVKKGKGLDDARRRRENATLTIRKDKREENLSKRRSAAVIPAAAVEGVPATVEVAKVLKKVSDFPEMMAGMQSGDTDMQIQNLIHFRRMLSAEKNPPVQECIDCGAVPVFVQFLARVDNKTLQFEAAWALTNIASTDRTEVIVDADAVDPLVELLGSVHPDVREQAAWALGNVAGDSPQLRDEVLKKGAMSMTLQNLSQPASISLLRNFTWTLSNFCRGKPQPAKEAVAPALPALAHLIQSSGDPETMIDACWACSYLSDGDNDRIKAVVDQNVIPSLVKMLQSDAHAQIIPALRTIGNIVSGSDKQTQAVVDSGFLAACVGLLQHPKKNIRKEACWSLSNIAAGSAAQLQVLMSTPGCLNGVLEQLDQGSEWDVRKEAGWVISNICTSGQPVHLNTLVESGVVAPLCDLLDVGDSKIVVLALEALEAILKVGEKGGDNLYVEAVQDADGIERLENLQEHENPEVYKKTISIIETYFSFEEEDENMAPAVTADANVFSFGMTPVNEVKGNVAEFGSGFTGVNQQQPQQPMTFNFGI